jgi:hypothetical protein
VGSERDAVDGPAGAGAQRPDQVLALHVPQTDRSAVTISDGEGPTVGTVGDAVDEIMSLLRRERASLLALYRRRSGFRDLLLICIWGLALTSRTLYIDTGANQVWSAQIPLQPAADQGARG